MAAAARPAIALDGAGIAAAQRRDGAGFLPAIAGSVAGASAETTIPFHDGLRVLEY